MGGVPVLLALAVVGVDYGYQPDGQGGVDYIVQVAPENWQQARESGVITSVVDPEVRGRVSRVIIRIGEGELPRDPGPGSVAPAQALVPRPAEIAGAGDGDFVPPPNLLASDPAGNGATAARVMRPGPQADADSGGGMGLPPQPANPSTAPATAELGQQLRREAAGVANEAANALRRGAGNASEWTAQATEDALSRLQAGEGTRPTTDAAAGARRASGASPPVAPPSTDPRPTAGQNAGGQNAANGPPSNASAATNRDDANWTSAPASPQRPSTGSPQPASSYDAPRSGNPGAANGASPASAAAGQAPARAPARAPTQGFGAQPQAAGANGGGGYAASAGSYDPNRTAGNAAAGLSARGYANNDPNAGRAASADPGRASGDAGTYGDPRSTPDLRVAGWDRYGRPLNAAGQLLPTAETREERYAMGAAGESELGPGPNPGRLANPGPANAPAGYSGEVPQYGRDRPATAPPRGEPAARQTSRESSSDGEPSQEQRDIAAQLAAARAALQETGGEKSENQSVVTQPVFNFLLLVSLVANAYLILTLSKLLQRYRHVVANMRSASASPHAGG